jgi:hypothetical protein
VWVDERRACSVRAACVQWVRRLHRRAVLQSRTALRLEPLVYKEEAHTSSICANWPESERRSGLLAITDAPACRAANNTIKNRIKKRYEFWLYVH